MEKVKKEIINRIISQKSDLAARITDLQFKKNPDLEKRYGKKGREKCNEDTLYHLNYLIEALRINSAALFTHYLEWAYYMLDSRNIPIEDLINQIRYIREVVSEQIAGPGIETVLNYLEKGAEHLQNLEPEDETFIAEGNPLAGEAREYLTLLLDGKRRQAADLIDEIVKSGTAVSDIYEHIFQATQYEIGVLWQRNQITVAKEHYCTAATQLIMARLYPLIFSNQKKGHKLVACSVANELHEIGIRMVSDFFEMDGWDTYYMGSNMPDSHLIESIRDHEANLLAISVTLPIHIGRVTELIKKIRRLSEFDELKIMAGGYPFGIIPGLYKEIGADATAGSARDAVVKANGMVN